MKDIKTRSKFRECEVTEINVKHINFICRCGRPFSVSRQQFYQKKRAKNFDCGCRGCVSKYFNNRLITSAKKGAIKRNIPFKIELKHLDEIYEKQNGVCFYSGVTLMLGDKYSGADWVNSNISIDRVDNKLGYTAENCVLCLKEIQLMKSTRTKEEVVLLANKVNKRQSISEKILEEILCLE